jgi:hypothetical protein
MENADEPKKKSAHTMNASSCKYRKHSSPQGDPLEVFMLSLFTLDSISSRSNMKQCGSTHKNESRTLLKNQKTHTMNPAHRLDTVEIRAKCHDNGLDAIEDVICPIFK